MRPKCTLDVDIEDPEVVMNLLPSDFDKTVT